MMLCAPCSLNTDNYADIRRKGVVNTAIMHKDMEQIFSDKMGVLIYLFVFHKV